MNTTCIGPCILRSSNNKYVHLYVCTCMYMLHELVRVYTHVLHDCTCRYMYTYTYMYMTHVHVHVCEKGLFFPVRKDTVRLIFFDRLGKVTESGDLVVSEVEEPQVSFVKTVNRRQVVVRQIRVKQTRQLLEVDYFNRISLQ